MTLPIPRQRASNPARLRTKLAIHLPRLSARRLRAGFAPPVLPVTMADLSVRRVAFRDDSLGSTTLIPGRRAPTLSSLASPPVWNSTRRSSPDITPSRSVTAAGLAPISWCRIIRIRQSPSPALPSISSFVEMEAGSGSGPARLATTSLWMSSTACEHSGLITRMLFQAYQFEFRPIALCPTTQNPTDQSPLPKPNRPKPASQAQLPTNELTTLLRGTCCQSWPSWRILPFLSSVLLPFPSSAFPSFLFCFSATRVFSHVRRHRLHVCLLPLPLFASVWPLEPCMSLPIPCRSCCCARGVFALGSTATFSPPALSHKAVMPFRASSHAH